MSTATLDHSGSPADPPRRPEPVTLVVDRPELATLLTTGLQPSALPCQRCGLRQGRHRPSTDCREFVRPQLPAGFGYADELAVGQEFSFLPDTTPSCRRRVLSSRCCVVGALIALVSRAEICASATHWVDGNLVVAT